MTIVPMPEASVNEDYGAIFRKYKVRLARQTFVVQQIAKASSMETSPDDHLRLGIPAANAGHHPTSNLGRNNVSHRRKPGPFL